LRGAPSLKTAVRKRLKLLGMSDVEIDALSQLHDDTSGLYLPTAGDTYWVYATLFESDLGGVNVGDAAVVTLPSNSDKVYSGTVRSLDPVVDSVTRSLRARIQIANPDAALKPDAYVDVVLQADLGDRLTVPRSAVFDTGKRQLVYVVSREIAVFGITAVMPGIGKGNHFEARIITTMGQTSKDVIVNTGLSAGDTVVVNALFMVDSETQLRATPEEHQGHVH
jgi:Cu(I)/Ag(I) efflux system membrane fusion protein